MKRRKKIRRKSKISQEALRIAAYDNIIIRTITKRMQERLNILVRIEKMKDTEAVDGWIRCRTRKE